MSPAPGVQTVSRVSPPSRSATTDIGRAFMVGVAERGPLAATAIRSVPEFERVFGARDTASYLYDSVEAKLVIGGGEVIVSRVVGANHATATVELFDQSGSTSPGDVSLIVEASSPGEWGNKLNVEVDIAGSDFILVVTHDDDGLVAASPALADRDAAVAWADEIPEIVVKLGASAEDPREQGPSALAGGTDDRANITTADWQAACDRFLEDFGAGQVTAPGVTTDAVHDVLKAHCAHHGNRVAILDVADTHSVDTLLPILAGLRADSDARYGTVFGPWAVVRGLLPGSTRTVPYSAIQAGLEARNAAAGLTAGDPAAGDFGAPGDYVLGLTQDPWTEEEREELNEAGFNVVRFHRGAVRTFGYRTLVDPVGGDRDWLEFNHARLNMQIVAEAREIAEKYLFRKIDGKGHTLGEFAGELGGMLNRLWLAGALFGETAEEAYRVDVGPSVNTPATLQARELRAVLQVRMSPAAEFVRIEIVKTPITETLAA